MPCICFLCSGPSQCTGCSRMLSPSPVSAFLLVDLTFSCLFQLVSQFCVICSSEKLSSSLLSSRDEKNQISGKQQGPTVIHELMPCKYDRPASWCCLQLPCGSLIHKNTDKNLSCVLLKIWVSLTCLCIFPIRERNEENSTNLFFLKIFLNLSI